MTDRELLLMTYGAIKNSCELNDAFGLEDLRDTLKEYLFPEKKRRRKSEEKEFLEDVKHDRKIPSTPF